MGSRVMAEIHTGNWELRLILRTAEQVKVSASACKAADFSCNQNTTCDLQTLYLLSSIILSDSPSICSELKCAISRDLIVVEDKRVITPQFSYLCLLIRHLISRMSALLNKHHFSLLPPVLDLFTGLNGRPTIGVYFLIITLIEFEEIDDVRHTLETLYQKGVTGITTDIVGGDGGYSYIASDFTELFLPQQRSLILHIDFRSTLDCSNSVPRSTTG
ncbi:hypothetical protein K457DRAFT_19226 [Linnemannia elongata AG-77]|uniref:Uncharacterized protein n=1 Tax=Linnemannia elongata AG-77 TaxID=1314771 RepID=A0A197JYA1_9FUNG|nr:hypothetical protein K457DRAFT_19226 [Linnemannia elongata AG-77]